MVAALTCACGTTSAPRSGGLTDQALVGSALGHYSEIVLAMNHAGIAALFEPDGEIVREGQAAVHGRAAIDSFLSGFASYQVLANNLQPASTVVNGDTAEQVGSYQQRVRTPEGKVLEVSGRFKVVWGRAPSGEWLIRRMGTSPMD